MSTPQMAAARLVPRCRGLGLDPPRHALAHRACNRVDINATMVQG